MNSLVSGPFKVIYSGESRHIGERLLSISERSYPVLNNIFNADRDIHIDIYWADKADWYSIPHCRYRSDYGMPHLSKGEENTHCIMLPAANIDIPEMLSRMIEPLLNISYLSQSSKSQLEELLMNKEMSLNSELKTYLLSDKFYVEYIINIVYIHEMMHAFSLEFGLPENFSNNGRKAWWVFEGMAQWSVLWVNRKLDNLRWSSIHEILYRWMYRSGLEQEGNINLHQYRNYAWFHGALVEMIFRLEDKFGEDFGTQVLKSLLQFMKQRNSINDREAINVFSEVAGQNLYPWFQENWGIEPVDYKYHKN